jgi:fatty-acyl-CoA synthase
VGVLAGEPVSIAPLAQAVWLCGGSVTMLHQPTARTDLAAWAEDTVSVLKMIDAALVVLGPPFDALAPVLTERGIPFRTIDALEGDPATVRPDAAVADEGDTALLQLTSGSTAEPKAVRITHANLHANITAMAQGGAPRRRPRRAGVVAAALPRHGDGRLPHRADDARAGPGHGHAAGLPRQAHPVGRADLQVPGHRHGRAELRLRRPRPPARALRRRAGPVVAAHRAERRRADRPGRGRRARGRRCAVRAAARVRALRVRDGGDRARRGVRAGGDGPGRRRDRRDDLETRRLATPGTGRSFPKLGPPLPGIEVRVVADDGAVLGERQVGVLQLRGPSVTPGYLTVHGPVATQDAEGWFDTGDEGYLVDGQVVVCGRRKDVIIMGGRNIYPTDIERAAGTADGVRAGNAVAVRIEAGEGRHRESFAVVVESRQASDPEAAGGIGKDVTSRVVSAVGVRPAQVVVLAPGSLPKTPSGKLRRAATAELLRG